ncbi:lipase maturation factor family protein [Magnetovibrio sp.]|uniref:lipase maturation factor family protein n=1 Tax=Magnetovibrio sp. TaxID=2024836 RepID=UPI002F946B02
MKAFWDLLWRPPEAYRLTILVFLKGLGLVYAIAFASLAVQIEGLSGSLGILPLVEQQANLKAALGPERFLAFPSVFWLCASDTALVGAAWLGCAAGVLLAFGLWPRVMLIAAYVLYLSLYHAGSIFMNFQWDTLLLEAGFLAIFLVGGGANVVVWMMRLLLFKLRFLSGISKLISGDPAWSGLGALSAYFEVQPLPHPGAWYFHHLPQGLLKGGTAGVLVVEILVPFLFLAPRRYRMVGAWATIALQVLIIASSNHNFVNILTILLCLFLLDDQALRRGVPALITTPPIRTMARGWRYAFAGFAAVIVATSALQIGAMVLDAALPRWAQAWERQVTAFALSNRYHVFPTMKPERIEVVVEWSYDAHTWTPLEFKYKPGDPLRAPQFIAPYHPRLDWHMWFVPMGRAEFVMPYQRFLARVRQGAKPVLDLLPENQFPHGSPRYLRAHLMHYAFTDSATRTRTGRWWTIVWRGPFIAIP